MKTVILVQTSVRALKKHKIRSFLTILGIMIGIAAIIVTFSIGRGAEVAVTQQIMSMGENSVYVIPSAFIKHGGLSGSAGIARLKKEDVTTIEKLSPEVEEISPMHATAQTVEYGATIVQQNIIGCYPNMPKIDASTIKYGNFFDSNQLAHRSNVVVLGSTPAEDLFGDQNPVGKIVLVNKQPCRVIGVLEKKAHYFGPRDPNARVFMPFTTAKKICRLPDETDDEVMGLAIRLYKSADTQAYRRKLRNILRFAHTKRETEEDPFTIFDQQTLEQVAKDASGIVRLFGLIAASISLLVGSIGVMNIMLVSVTERTNEIGLRMAVGATQRLIQAQFLIESTTLSFVGGLIGIFLGLISQFLVGYATNLSPVIEIAPMIASLFLTILIGVFFGYYPAYQASQLNPVEALRER